MPRTRKDITGQRFGKLTAIEYVEYHTGQAFWRCKCDCGNECVIGRNRIKAVQVPSCGCATKWGGYRKNTTKLKEKCLELKQDIHVEPPPPPELDTRDKWTRRKAMAAAYRRRIGQEGTGKQDAEKYCAAKAGGHGMEWHDGV